MTLNYLHPSPGSKKPKKRLGRGIGSGCGKTSGRGHKGQKARSGGGVRIGFEGGQMPFHRRLPKRGFNNKVFKKQYELVHINQLNKFDDGADITVDTLKSEGLVSVNAKLVKILCRGNLTKKLNIIADKFSKSAKAQIENAGGKAKVRKVC